MKEGEHHTGGVAVVHCAPGTRHRTCRRALRLVAGGQRPALIISHANPRTLGADIQLALPASQTLTAAAREQLDEHFDVWTLAGWLVPGATATVHARGGRWGGVAPSVLNAFIEDLARFAFGATPAAPRPPQRWPS